MNGDIKDIITVMEATSADGKRLKTPRVKRL